MEHELQQLFAFYRPEVEAIHRRRANAASEELPEYISAGSEAEVFRLLGRSVVKFPIIDPVTNFVDTDGWIHNIETTYPRGRGVRGLEQIKAYNKRDPAAAVFGHIEGHTVRTLDEEARLRMTDSHYIGLLATFYAMQERGLATDTTSRNILWDEHRGFAVIDYKYDPRQTVLQKITYFASREVLLEEVDRDEEVPEYGLHFRDLCRQLLGQSAVNALNESWEQEGLLVR